MVNGKQRILIVDDERINRNLLADILKSEYTVSMAKNGEQTLKIVFSDAPPNLILLDIMMPEMDGYAVCQRIKSEDTTKHIPIIFITAMSDCGNETKGLELGAVDYIIKPISPSIVKVRVKHHLERAQINLHLEELVEKRTAELKQAKEEAEQAKQIAETANKAKGDFLMNMSHELRTPLNGIITAAELTMDYKLNSDIIENQEIIKNSGYEMLSLIERILDFSRCVDGKLILKEVDFSLGDLLNQLNRTFFIKGKKTLLNLSIQLDTETTPNALIGDPKCLNEIINNLLENAAKFTQRETRATLAIDVLEKTPDTALLQISVTDNGIGVAPDQWEKIFEPFFQVDMSINRPYDGVGMGLSICHKYVARLGGTIWVESELGKGSTFYFTAAFKRQNKEQPFNLKNDF